MIKSVVFIAIIGVVCGRYIHASGEVANARDRREVTPVVLSILENVMKVSNSFYPQVSRVSLDRAIMGRVELFKVYNQYIEAIHKESNNLRHAAGGAQFFNKISLMLDDARIKDEDQPVEIAHKAFLLNGQLIRLHQQSIKDNNPNAPFVNYSDFYGQDPLGPQHNEYANSGTYGAANGQQQQYPHQQHQQYPYQQQQHPYPQQQYPQQQQPLYTGVHLGISMPQFVAAPVIPHLTVWPQTVNYPVNGKK